MSRQNTFNIQDEHEALMNALQRAALASDQTTAAAVEALKQIVEHNLDLSAHPDIRDLIQKAGEATSIEAVDERISQHDESQTCHPDLRKSIEDLKSNTEYIIPTVTEAVSTHNADPTSHGDIREAINNLKAQVGGLNVSDIKEDLNALTSTVNDIIKPDIAKLQSVDARHDAAIAKNAEDIKKINAEVTAVNDNIAQINVTLAEAATDIDDCNLKVHSIDREIALGLPSTNVTGAPNITGMKHNLPTYVKKGAATKFIISGVTCNGGGTDHLQINFTKGLGNYTLTPMSGYVLGSEATLTPNASEKDGNILDIIVEFKDTSTNKAVKRVISTMIAKALQSSSLSVNGLAKNVEPNATITFRISNAVDKNNNRFSYSVNPLQSGITFTKQDGIAQNEEVRGTIPSSAERDTDLTFRVTAHDTLGSDVSIDVSTHVNKLPDTEDLVHNVPSLIIPGKKYNIKFSGITSVDGKNATYEIQNTGTSGKITFSKSSGILANENVIMTVDSSAVRGTTYNFKVKTMDENGASITVTISTAVNQLPESATVRTTLPADSQGGKTLSFRISGGTDVNQGQSRTVVNYAIEASSSALTFSKTSNITTSDNVTVALPKVSSDSVRKFKIYTVDDMGERSATAKEISLTITPIYVLNTPTITSPKAGAVVPHTGFTITWSALSWSTDTRNS